MIGKKGFVSAIAPGAFSQLESKFHFPFDLMRKRILGYVNLGVIWILYEEEEQIIKVPFARNKKWFEAIISEPEFAALRNLKHIYVI